MTYRFGNPDDESLPLTRCACGQEFKSWEGPVLSIYADDPTLMPCCGRRLWFSQAIAIHEIEQETDTHATD